jgi:hypothetical protein
MLSVCMCLFMEPVHIIEFNVTQVKSSGYSQLCQDLSKHSCSGKEEVSSSFPGDSSSIHHPGQTQSQWCKRGALQSKQQMAN